MVTLDRLVNVLGGYGVRLRHCPIPPSTSLRSVVMHEQTGDRLLVGDVLLGMGATAAEALDWAASAHAVVVLIRDDARDDDGSGITDDVAVMVVDPAMSRSELAAVVYGLVLEGCETESGRGPTDLFALADILADATGGAVTIEDALSQVLAYSRLQQHADRARVQTIMDRQAPEPVREFFDSRGVFAHLTASDAPLFIDPDVEHGMSGRMVAAVRSGRELMGSVWVACTAPLHGEMEVYSVESPLGAAILGARTGQRRTYRLPSGTELSVTLLKAVPYGVHTAAVS